MKLPFVSLSVTHCVSYVLELLQESCLVYVTEKLYKEQKKKNTTEPFELRGISGLLQGLSDVQPDAVNQLSRHTI